jgi:C-terminal processing protease CtpA/Prc
MDTGASLPLLTNTTSDSSLSKPPFVFNTILGIGITGPIMGFLGKINKIELQNFKINNAVCYFQDDVDLGIYEANKRQGIIGNMTLSKFTVFIDYFRRQVFLKTNKYFEKPIEYDLSGMSIHAFGPNFKQFLIKDVIKGTPADKAGFQIYDEILQIGRSKAKNTTLDGITEKLSSKPGRHIKIVIRRGDEILTKNIILADYLIAS